jgi:AraC family transcriptional regulator
VKGDEAMGYRDDMERCRAFIDAHLSETLAPQALSERFGYSYYHFCHVFRAVNGMAVCEYVRERRLHRSARELLGGKSVTEAAMDCGFDTPSGFTRAFIRRFGTSPSEYKQKGGMRFLEPEMKKMAAFTAVGYVLKPDKNADFRENGAYWLGKDFSSVSKEDYAKLCIPGHGEIGAWLHPSDSADELHYFFGPITNDKSFVPRGMEAIDVPAASYAVFPVPKAADMQGLHENVKKTWKFIFNDWFDKSGLRFDHDAMDFEYYLGEDTYIYVPVK